jgi:glycosyltransferase involved in cell wall biosynthesis
VKSVLYIARHFPPVGGAGVQRTVYMIRYLREAGWAVTVITGAGDGLDRWTPRDDSLSSVLPDDVEVIWLPAPEPAAASSWRGRVERWLGVEPAWDAWWISGACSRATAAPAIDAIVATMSPFASAVAATRLSERLDVPWLADLRDPWALDEMTAYPTAAHRRLHQRRMRHRLGTASAIVMNTPEAAKVARARFPELAPRVVDAIPNGYAPADFSEPAPARSDAALRIVHTGYLHTDLRGVGVLRRMLSVGDVRVDRAARSHVHLLEAITTVAGSTARPIELHLAGVLSAADRAAIPGSVRVHDHGYLHHAESVRLLRSADLLFLPMHDLPDGRRATIVPGKTYEYLASGRPILAAVPAGDARDLLERAVGVSLCDPTDVAAMARIIAVAAASGPVGDVDRERLLRPFRRDHQAARLAEVLDSVIVGRAVAERSAHLV